MLSPGTEVFMSSDPTKRGAIVGERHTADGAREHHVLWTRSATKTWESPDSLEAVDEGDLAWVSQDSFRVELLKFKRFHEFSDIVFSMGWSKTEFLPYQFKPVLQFIRQDHTRGLLIADEVGLGKTIEAALIMQELKARDALRRLLVVCPANLVQKWQAELSYRFGIDLIQWKKSEFEELARKQRAGHGHNDAFAVVASLEGIRRLDPPTLLYESGVTFDLTVIDEAHHMRNRETANFALGRELGIISDRLVLLSATPLQTGQDDLLSLLRIVDRGTFDDMGTRDFEQFLQPNRHVNRAVSHLGDGKATADDVLDALAPLDKGNPQSARNPIVADVMSEIAQQPDLTASRRVAIRSDLLALHTLAPYYSRTRKRDVQAGATRNSNVESVELAENEIAFYEAWVAFLRAREFHKTTGIPSVLPIIQRERLAASSIQAARAKAEILMSGIPDDEIASGFEGEYDEYDPDDDVPWWWRRSSWDGVPSLKKATRDLKRAAQQLGDTDTKLDAFTELLRRLLGENPHRKILVFTFFRDTLANLQERLQAAQIYCCPISGSVPPNERHSLVSRFRDTSDLSVLLSTEVGAEGIDLQFCDAIVNYDLPWNPMRVEQRIGRIDRYGQRADQVVVASFFTSTEIDRRILHRLYERINVFKQSVGGIEPILGPIISRLQADAFRGGLTPEQLEERADREALRAEQEIRDAEAFESSRAELVGHGDIAQQDIAFARESGRYVSQEELFSLFRHWLKEADPGIGRISRHSKGVYRVQASEPARSQLRSLIESGNESAAEPIIAGMDRTRRSPITFDSEIARERDDVAYLHLHHPVVRAMIRDDLDQEDEPPKWIARVAAFTMPAQVRRAAGDTPIALAIFRLALSGGIYQISGAPSGQRKPGNSRMLAVAIDIETLAHRDDLGDPLLAALHKARKADPPAAFTLERAKRVEQVALDAGRQFAEELQERESRLQQSRIAVRRESQTRFYEGRLRTHRERRDRYPSDAPQWQSFNGKMEAEEGRRDRALAALERLGEPTVGTDLLSMAVFTP